MTAAVSIMPKLRRLAQIDALLERVDVFEPRDHWWERGGCHDCPTDWWYQGGPKSKGAAICDTCPVRMDCLTDTIRLERQLPNVEEVGGHRCVSALARRQYLTRIRTTEGPT